MDRLLRGVRSHAVNEHVLLTSAELPPGGVLTPTQFHGLIDGALRHPPAGPDPEGGRSSRPDLAAKIHGQPGS